MTEGWIGGMVVGAALKSVKGTPNAASIRQAMEGLKVDTKGLRGGPLEWTPDNHFRTHQYYRVYRWDTGKNAIVQAKDWFAFDVK
jgi:hypothetical protein